MKRYSGHRSSITTNRGGGGVKGQKYAEKQLVLTSITC